MLHCSGHRVLLQLTDGRDDWVQDALLPGQVLHRRLSSVDSTAQAGDSSGLMPHTALRRCLDAWVPLLIDECDFAAAFLLLYKPIDEVPGAGQDPYAAGIPGGPQGKPNS